MKRFFKILAIIVLIVISFSLGVMYTLNNQIVTNEAHEVGNYEVNLKGYKAFYWYE